MVIVSLVVSSTDTACSKHKGTAVHSLAGEHLQDLDGLVGSERQKQEKIIKEVMGSIYQGEILYLYSRIGQLALTRPLLSRF